MSCKIENPYCKRCERKPSLMGKEPMILIPKGATYFVLCGSCLRKLLVRFGKKIKPDFMNLFTHIDSTIYNDFLLDFLGSVR